MNDLEFLLGDDSWIIESRPIRAGTTVLLFLFYTSSELELDQVWTRFGPDPPSKREATFGCFLWLFFIVSGEFLQFVFVVSERIRLIYNQIDYTMGRYDV